MAALSMSRGLMNSILAAMIILITHVLLKNSPGPLDRTSEHMTGGSETYAQTTDPAMTSAQGGTGASPASATNVPESSPGPAGPTTVIATRGSSGMDDLLAYVYGSQATDDAGPDPDMKIVAVGAPEESALRPAPPLGPPPCLVGGAAQTQKRTRVPPMDGDTCGRMIVGAYMDENAMCGGTLYDGEGPRLGGYDGAGSGFGALIG